MISRGYRVLHQGTTIPHDASGGELIRVMARAAHNKASELLFDSEDRKLPEWDKLTESTRHFSASCMHAAFVALVVQCGASVEEIPEIDDDA